MNDETLKAGDVIERKIAGLLFSAGWFVGGRKSGYSPSRDIDVLSPNFAAWERVEVKNESKYATSPNVCVETFQGEPRHPSGIMVSESTVTIHYFSDQRIAMYRTQGMRLWLPCSLLVEGVFRGSDNTNGGYLVPVDRSPVVSVCNTTNIVSCKAWIRP